MLDKIAICCSHDCCVVLKVYGDFISDSRTVGFLEAYGVLGLLEQIWSTVFYYTSIIYG